MYLHYMHFSKGVLHRHISRSQGENAKNATPYTFSPVQDGCVQLRMDGYLQANETSTDKMS